MGILIRPLLNEKYTALNNVGKYGFEVALNANKVEIRKAVEKLYGVRVEEVKTMRQIGKSKSRSTRTKVTAGNTQTYKKAIVTVAAGEVIDFYEGI